MLGIPILHNKHHVALFIFTMFNVKQNILILQKMKLHHKKTKTLQPKHVAYIVFVKKLSAINTKKVLLL